MKANRINCLNQWDIQSKHVFSIDGICEALYAGECRYGGGEHYVVYEREQSEMSESVGCGRKEDIQDGRMYADSFCG